MGLESSVTQVSDLNSAWPLSTDLKSEGDNHLRNIKVALKSLLTNKTQIIPRVVNQETPSVAPGVTFDTVSVAHPPAPPESLHLYRNGLLLKYGSEYTIFNGNQMSVAHTSSGPVFSATYTW